MVEVCNNEMGCYGIVLRGDLQCKMFLVWCCPERWERNGWLLCPYPLIIYCGVLWGSCSSGKENIDQLLVILPSPLVPRTWPRPPSLLWGAMMRTVFTTYADRCSPWSDMRLPAVPGPQSTDFELGGKRELLLLTPPLLGLSPVLPAWVMSLGRWKVTCVPFAPPKSPRLRMWEEDSLQTGILRCHQKGWQLSCPNDRRPLPAA